MIQNLFLQPLPVAIIPGALIPCEQNSIFSTLIYYSHTGVTLRTNLLFCLLGTYPTKSARCFNVHNLYCHNQIILSGVLKAIEIYASYNLIYTVCRYRD